MSRRAGRNNDRFYRISGLIFYMRERQIDRVNFFRVWSVRVG